MMIDDDDDDIVYFGMRWKTTLWTEKNTQKCCCNIFHKTQSILIKFGTRCPKLICDTVV